MYRLIRPILFELDAELIHRWAMWMLALLMRIGFVRALFTRYFRVRNPALEQRLWGIVFENPVGLAAGFDKNARYFNALSALGFGSVEVGTITAVAQDGNPRPRLFRLPKDRALLNRMGFNNEGSQAVANRLQNTRIETILGINLGKSRVVEFSDALTDYETSFEKLFDYGHYFVVNVSSPNTPGLRDLQQRGPLLELLQGLQALNQKLAMQRNTSPRPLLVKISPDLSDQALDDILAITQQCKISGIIASNTTLERDNLRTSEHSLMGSGGISGLPVQARTQAIISKIYTRTHGRLPIIGVGGIFDAEDALRTIEAGASLVQIWTGFVYEGPFAVRRINRDLIRLCHERGYTHISDAVGKRSRPLQIGA